ncbi:MAG: thiamine diphosphokinase [Pseudomonadota bacterium]
MTTKLKFDRPVCLLGGGDVPKDLASVLPSGPLICADSGADYALLAGREPTAIIGDMDSINPTVRSRFADLVHLVEDQDSTDFEKCLRAIEAPFVFGFGFLGRRMDHTIASLSTLAKFSATPIALVGDGDVIVALRTRATFEIGAGDTVGILPWPEAQCTSTGLEWELDGLHLRLGTQVSSSNRARVSEVTIDVEEGLILVTLPSRLTKNLPSAFGLSSTR